MIAGLGMDGTKRRQTFSPTASALLILDMQRYFLDSDSHAAIPSMRDIIPSIASLASAFSSIGRPVVMTRHLNTDENAAMMGRWWSDLIREEDEKSRIVPELSFSYADIIVKTQYNAFYATELEEFLRRAGVEQLVMTGVMTHLCLESTARAAFVRGFETFVPADSTATYNRELHEGSLRGLAHGFAVPVLSADITGAIEDAR